MNDEIVSIPITRDSMLYLHDAVMENPASPIVVPLSYALVTVPGALAECIDGVLHDPGAVYVNDMNVPVGPSHFLADERGRIYDAISVGITALSLMQVVKENTTSVWTLQLNLSDPTMPGKLKEFHRQTPAIGLVALVIPQSIYEYTRALEEFDPLIYYPNQ